MQHGAHRSAKTRALMHQCVAVFGLIVALMEKCVRIGTVVAARTGQLAVGDPCKATQVPVAWNAKDTQWVGHGLSL